MVDRPENRFLGSLEHEVKRFSRFLPSPNPRLEDHVSVWSVTARNARTFFRIVGTFWIVALVFIIYKTPYERSGPGEVEDWRSRGEFALGVLSEFGSVGIALVIVSMILTPGVNIVGGMLMTLYQRMVNRYVIPVIEAHKAEGRAEGREEVMAEWREWNERRLAAERAGREFAEPPPGTRRDDGS